jgi:hypothetical protein
MSEMLDMMLERLRRAFDRPEQLLETWGRVFPPKWAVIYADLLHPEFDDPIDTLRLDAWVPHILRTVPQRLTLADLQEPPLSPVAPAFKLQQFKQLGAYATIAVSPYLIHDLVPELVGAQHNDRFQVELWLLRYKLAL